MMRNGFMVAFLVFCYLLALSVYFDAVLISDGFGIVTNRAIVSVAIVPEVLLFPFCIYLFRKMGQGETGRIIFSVLYFSILFLEVATPIGTLAWVYLSSL